MIEYRCGESAVICADSTDPDVAAHITREYGHAALVIADPPYGNIIPERWDRIAATQQEYAQWMRDWTGVWVEGLLDGGAMYVWGGYGVVNFRPFQEYICTVERDVPVEVANLITWGKKRARGIQWGYLQTREDVVYLVKGNHKKPRAFTVPLLDKERGYAGYNPKYPAKSKFLRRTSVWTDITEIFRGKVHPTEKPARLYEVIVAASSNPGDLVVDPFAESGVTALVARELGRRFVVVEQDPEYVELILKRLSIP